MLSCEALTKSQEIAAYREWVESLPATSYLADMFRGTEEWVASLIHSDLVTSPLHELHGACREAKAELDDLQKRRVELAKEVRDLERTRERLAGGLDELRRDARRLAGM